MGVKIATFGVKGESDDDICHSTVLEHNRQKENTYPLPIPYLVIMASARFCYWPTWVIMIGKTLWCCAQNAAITVLLSISMMERRVAV